MATTDSMEVDQEDAIRIHVEDYMSYIAECVPPIDLACLPYFTKAQRQELFHSSSRPYEATHKALSIILSRDDPGRFVHLKHTMETKGFPKIVNILSGNVICDRNYRRIVELFGDEVVNRLKPLEVLPHLLKYDVITQREAEEVRAEERNHGDTRASWQLLHFLPQRTDDWFKSFLMSLIDSGSSEIAKILDEDLYEKICVQNEATQQDIMEQFAEDEADMTISYDVIETAVAIVKDSHEITKSVIEDTDRQTTTSLSNPDKLALDVLQPLDQTTMHTLKVLEEFTLDDLKNAHPPNTDTDETPCVVKKHPDETTMHILKMKDETTMDNLNDTDEITFHVLGIPDANNMDVIKDTYVISEACCNVPVGTVTNSPNQTLETRITVLKNADETVITVTHHEAETIINVPKNRDETTITVLKYPEGKTLTVLKDPGETFVNVLKTPDSTVAGLKHPDPTSRNTIAVPKNADCSAIAVDENAQDRLMTVPMFADRSSIVKPTVKERATTVAEPSANINTGSDESREVVMSLPKYAAGVQSNLQQYTDVEISVIQPTHTDDNIDSANDSAITNPKWRAYAENDSAKYTDVTKKAAEPSDAVTVIQESTYHNDTEDYIASIYKSIETNLDCASVQDNTSIVYMKDSDSDTRNNVATGTELPSISDAIYLKAHDNSLETDVTTQQHATEPGDNCSIETTSTYRKEIVSTEAGNAKLFPLDGNDDRSDGGMAGSSKQENVTKDHNGAGTSGVDKFMPDTIANTEIDGTKKKMYSVPKNIPDTPQKIHIRGNTNDLNKHNTTRNEDVDRETAQKVVSDYISQADIESLSLQFDRLQTNTIDTSSGSAVHVQALPSPMCEISKDRCGEQQLNITTDVDELDNTEERDIQLYGYQVELVTLGCEGENTIIMAPTNTGKTWMACKIIQEHFRRNRGKQICKAAFIVDNEALAGQQMKVISDLLTTHRAKMISGSRQREKNEYLSAFIDRRDIFVLTAQILVNALRDNTVDSVGVFSIIVFDECHHTTANHPYNAIMHHYMDMKLSTRIHVTDLPQIIGLTASVGCGGRLEVSEAIKHIKGLMASLDAKSLCTVRDKKNIEELSEHVLPPYEEIVITPHRSNDVLKRHVEETMRKLEMWICTHESVSNLRPKDMAYLKKTIATSPPVKGTEQYIQWLSAFDQTIAALQTDTNDARIFLNNCRMHLEDYNRALLLYKDARAEDFFKYLEDPMQDRQSNPLKDDTERGMLIFYEDLRTNRPLDDGGFNPKLTKMKEIIVSILENREDGRGIVFVKTRALATALIDWMGEDDELKTLNPNEFVGQSASAAAGGTTKSGQRNILDCFKEGRHRLIVATSVADEGLDIPKCNLVIRYEHVTNEIVRVQSRGRARAPGSKYYVITETGSPIADKEELNARLEPVMHRAVGMLQKAIEARPNSWEQEINNRQVDAKNERDAAEKKRREALIHGECELQCFKCGQFICMSFDVKKIQNSHHIIIDEDVHNRVLHTRSPVPEFEDADFKYDGNVFCGKCGECLGGVCEHRGIEFPLIRINAFRVVDKNGKGQRFAKWKKVKGFVVEAISNDDLLQILLRRQLQSD